MTETILVTGGAGFLGSHVADCLAREGNEVIALDDLSGGFRDNVQPGIEFVEGSILDEPLLDALFRERRIDHVYHLAAYAAEGLSHFIRGFNYTNNLVGSVNLVNRAVNHRAKSFVFTSSIAVYGPNQVPMREESTPEPEDPYGIAKLAVEQDLAAARRLFGLNFVIFRPHNIYGERQNIGDPYRNVIGIFMNQLMSDKPMTVFGDGTQTRAFTYVGDIAPVIASAHRTEKAYGEVFNIGADQPYDLNALAAAVAAEMGVSPRIDYLAARKEVQHAFSSHEKVRKFFACPPDTSLEQGLKTMCHWARSVGARRGKKFSKIEIPTGLPPSWQALMTAPEE
jgi:UDP-glucose 4-epimerase